MQVHLDKKEFTFKNDFLQMVFDFKAKQTNKQTW